jgi:hypothetical protein
MLLFLIGFFVAGTRSAKSQALNNKNNSAVIRISARKKMDLDGEARFPVVH